MDRAAPKRRRGEIGNVAATIGGCDAFRVLAPRERTVLALRFGIGYDRAHSLEEAGKELGVTRERARQIEAQALSRLRDDPVVRRLRAYLS